MNIPMPRGAYRAALSVALIAAALACSTGEILDVTDPDVIDPSAVSNATGAAALRVGALARFNTATSGAESMFLFSGPQSGRRAVRNRQLWTIGNLSGGKMLTKISALAMGNAQRLDNGNLFVGWGTAQRISEFAEDGTLLFDATLPDVSYRAFRQVWR